MVWSVDCGGKLGSIYRNNGYWYYQAYVEQAEGHKLRIQRSLHTKDETAAKLAKRDWDRKIRNGVFVAPRVAFDSIVEDYLRERKRLVESGQLSQNTLHPDKVSFAAFQKFLSTISQTVYLDELDGESGEQIFENFIRFRTDQGKSPNTIRRELSHIRTLFSKLQRNRSETVRITDSPFQRLSRPTPTKRRDFPSQNSWLRLRDYLRAEVKSDGYEWFKCMIHLQVETGARISEVRTMKWRKGRDDTHEGSSLTFSYLYDDNQLWSVHFKRRLRTVPIGKMGPTDGSLPALIASIPRRNMSVYVFENAETKRPYLLNSTAKMFRRLLESAGVTEEFTTHGNRHGFISYLLNNGWSSYQVGQLVGHSDSQITEMYGHVDIQTLGSLFESLREPKSRGRRKRT